MKRSLSEINGFFYTKSWNYLYHEDRERLKAQLFTRKYNNAKMTMKEIVITKDKLEIDSYIP